MKLLNTGSHAFLFSGHGISYPGHLNFIDGTSTLNGSCAKCSLMLVMHIMKTFNMYLSFIVCHPVFDVTMPVTTVKVKY